MIILFLKKCREIVNDFAVFLFLNIFSIFLFGDIQNYIYICLKNK